MTLLRLLVVLALALVGLAAPTAPVLADDPATSAPPAGAPITRPDRVEVAADSVAEIDVLANDTDPDAPDGDDLAVCRVEASADAPIGLYPTDGYGGYDESDDDGRPVLMVAPEMARPGTYTLDYHVCDYDYLTPATLTVRVTGRQETYATAQEGRVRFRNPGQRRVVVRYGSKDGRTIDGRFALAPRSARTVRTPRRAIQWTATVRTRHGTSTSGHLLTGIQQPAGRSRPAESSGIEPSAADLAAWRLGLHQTALRASDARVDGAASGSAARDEGTDAPLTAPDTVSVSRGFFGLVDVLANDTDPDGPAADLAICRVTVPGRTGLAAQILSGAGWFLFYARGLPRPRVAEETRPSLAVVASDRTREGTYQLTYHACDRQYLTPGTVTVTVTRSEKVTARKLPRRPRVVRFTNPGPHGAVVHVQDYSGDPLSTQRPPTVARFRLPAGTSANVRPGVRTIVWSASSRRGPGGSGFVSGIGRTPRG